MDARITEARDKSAGKWNGGEHKWRTTIHAQWIQQTPLETEGAWHREHYQETTELIRASADPASSQAVCEYSLYRK